MLQTQVAYWANVENKRHNLATEAATLRDLGRKDKELEALIKYRAEEVAHWKNQLSEQTRHNLVTEGYTKAEIKIHDKQARAALKQAEAALKNAETQRRDLANKEVQATSSYISAKASESQAQTAEGRLDLDKQRFEVDATRASYQNVVDLQRALSLAAEREVSAVRKAQIRKEAELLQKQIDLYTVEKIGLPLLREYVKARGDTINGMTNLIKVFAN